MNLAVVLQHALGNDYRVDQELVGGGMSRVYLATDLKHDRKVVIKALPHDLLTPESAARFKREIKWTIRLQHPNILPILTSGQLEQCLFYVAPYISGESLKTRLQREERLPLVDIVRFLRDISDALAFAHAEGIVHRDVKPGNILLSGGHALLADFGIARTVETETSALTASGMLVGTPAYMNPELSTDESSDVFSLGVVAYELLCGALPTRSVTPSDVRNARGAVAADDRRTLQALSILVAAVISGPKEQRIRTASEFLSRVEKSTARQPMFVAVTIPALLVTAALLVAGAYVVRSDSDTSMVATAYAVANVSGGPESEAIVRETEMHLAEWRGLTLVETTLPHQVAFGDATALIKSAVAMHARNAIAIDTRPHGDSVDVHASLYDASTGKLVRQSVAVVARVDSDANRGMTMRRFVNSLLRDGAELPWYGSDDRSTPTLSAWQAYDEGRLAIRRWHLSDARAAFQRAISLDENSPLSHLWLARVLAWDGDAASAEQGQLEAIRALGRNSALRFDDSLHAAALAAFFGGEYPKACRLFRQALARDSASFTAWLGVGDCLTSDRAVITDHRTITGWAFRSSFAEAGRAYTRAAAAADVQKESAFRAWILGRLSKVYFSMPNQARDGVLADRDTVVMAAFPYIEADTLAFAPHPLRDFATRKGDPPPDRVQAAALRARDLLRASAEEWVRQSPRDPAAYDSLAALAEIAGGVATVNGEQKSTLEILRLATQLSGDSTQHLRLAMAEMRALLKQGIFDTARVVAESLFAAGAQQHVRDTRGVIGIGAILGHVHDVAKLLPMARVEHRVRLGDGTIWTPPTPLAASAEALLTYAAFGANPDSVRALTQRTLQLIDSYVPDSGRATQVRSALVASTFGYGDPAIAIPAGLEIRPPDEVVRAVTLLARGDSAGARGQLHKIESIDRGKLPGNGLRMAFRVARTWVALRDTAAAIKELDGIIRTLPTLDPAVFNDVAHLASLVRVFALHADLEFAQGHVAQARVSARAVTELWDTADSELQPLVRRMRAISSPH